MYKVEKKDGKETTHREKYISLKNKWELKKKKNQTIHTSPAFISAVYNTLHRYTNYVSSFTVFYLLESSSNRCELQIHVKKKIRDGGVTEGR